MFIFSDVDGTFLGDDGTIPFDAAELAAIARDHTVVFCSSRTGAELRALQARVGWRGWAIAEDGAVLVPPAGEPELLGDAREALVAALRERGQGAALAALVRQAPQQQDRLASILVPRAVADAPAWAAFRAAALSANVRCSPGGRWATLTRRADKGEAALALCRRLREVVEVAIGNDANDAGLLAVAVRPFVVRNPEGHHAILAALPRVSLLDSPGPQGWKEMVRALMAGR